MLVRNDESEEDVLERIKNKRKKLEEIFGEEFETDTENIMISLEESKCTSKPSRDYLTDSPPDVNDAAGKGARASSQPIDEAAECRSGKSDGELEGDCKDCFITEQNCPPPRP